MIDKKKNYDMSVVSRIVMAHLLKISNIIENPVKC